MKLWMSGRLDYDIDFDKFRIILNEVEKKINATIQDNDYGSAIDGWDVILVIYQQKSEPVFKYSTRTKETDIEIPIDHEKFKNGTMEEGRKLFFDALVLSLHKLSENKKVIGFNFQKAIEDVTAIAGKN